jgi:hypothetical protein
MEVNSAISVVAKLPQHHSVEYHGISIVIEWPKGCIREGRNKDGKTWRREMKADYGFIDDTSAAGDAEPLDIYIGKDRDEDRVYVIEQLDEDGEFDEYKLVTGVPSLESAVELYLAHYPKEWGDDRVGDCYETSLDALKAKVEEHQGNEAGGGKSASLEEVGRQWDSLGQFNLRLGWLRTQAHICEDWMKFARPWSQLTDAQKAKVAKRAAEVSEPGYNHKEADLIRKLSGGQAGAIEKVVRILGSNGIGSLIVGGVAVQEYGHPRYTKDTDLVVLDVGKAREVLLQNGYKEGKEDWDVFDPEFGEEIELLRGGSKIMFSDVPMPMPQEVNTRPKFCDLPTLLDLKIAAFLDSENAFASYGLPPSKRADRVDVEVLISNNQLPRDFLQGKTHQEEYAKVWDAIHNPPRKRASREELLIGDDRELLDFYNRRMAVQREDSMDKTAGDEKMVQLWNSVKGTGEDQAGTTLTGFCGDGPATCMDCIHRTPHSKDENGEEVDSCNHKLVKLDPELTDRRLPDGTIRVDADDWCRFAQKPRKEGEGKPANAENAKESSKKPVVGSIYLSTLASMKQ